MANTSPDYLPTYLLPTNSSPSTADSILIQTTSGTDDDVELATILNIMDCAIDTTTTTLFSAMGWGGVS